MMRFMAMAALVALAGCGDGSNPIAGEQNGPVLTGSALPNLYISYILPQRDANGVLKARIRVCNNGTASADASTTYLEHWYGLTYEIHDLYTTNLPAGWCTTVLSPALGGGDDVGHSYYARADDDLVITESNENDNEKEVDVVP